MAWLLNIVYGCLLTLLSPVIAWRTLRHGRYRRGVAEKLFGRLPNPCDDRPRVWFHAVSVGEIIQLQKVVAEFRRQTADACAILVTTSTDTGYDLARQRFDGCQVSWFPLDFSWAVRHALARVQPALVVLMELELWPNFLGECHRRSIPVAIVNARMSERSHRRYLNVRRLLAPMFGRLSLVAAQSETAGARLLALGVRSECLRVTGSIKFDGVSTSRDNAATMRLRELFGLAAHEQVFIAGSTQEPEELLALDAWLTVRRDHPDLRLILVPRHRERFDEVAALITSRGLPLVRRSECLSSPATMRREGATPVLLLDTIGELGACWGLADIAFVGGSFGSRGGQNMIEPAAFGACILFGPNTWNFRDVVQSFRDANACIELQSPSELLPAVAGLLGDPIERARLTTAARSVVLAQQGATHTTARLLAELLPSLVSHSTTARDTRAA